MSIVSISIAKIIAAGALINQWANGSSTATVATEGGLIPTLAKISADAPGNIIAALTTTSASVLPVAVGPKSFTVEPGKKFKAGQWVSAVSGVNYMIGTVTSYSGTTLAVSVLQIGGAGTVGAWQISFTGPAGPAGSAGGGSGGQKETLIVKFPWEN